MRGEGALIDPRAIIDPSARIGANVHIGPWTIIDADVEIGDECWIASHVVLRGPTRLGPRNRIYQFATVGEATPAVVYRGEPTTLDIGADNVIREGVTIHRGTVQDQGRTVVGDHNLFMAYVHVGHDCIVGSNVIMANNSSASGHVRVGDHANIGGYAGIPQYRTIGAYTMIGGMSLVLKDVPAFVSVSGNPAAAVGMNVEGMRRRNLANEVVEALREAYRIVYRGGLTTNAAVEACTPLAAKFVEVRQFLDSILSSKLGIIRPRHESHAD